MHSDEFTLMNIHEGEYFRIMVVKILISYLLDERTSLLDERTDGLQQRKHSIEAESRRPTHVAVVVLQAHANNLTNASGFEGCYLRNRCGFVRHQHVDISRRSILEAGVDAQLACIGQDNVLLRVLKHQRVYTHLV